MTATFVTRDLFRFLRELRRHNEPQWFNAHKDEYVSVVRDPLCGFVAAVGPGLRAISPHLVVDPRPSGGSLLRIYRDTRFSRDKTPYKTNAALSFRLAPTRRVESPGYYLHLEPGMVFMGAGMWRPSAAALRAIREGIVKNPTAWAQVRRPGLSHRAESLKRPPRGVDPDHPFVEDLKRTSFTRRVEFTETEACSAEFPAVFVRACRRQAPLMRFLAGAMGLPF